MTIPGDERPQPRTAHPLRFAILLSALALGPALGLTHVVVRGYRAHEHHLSEEWTVRAEERFEAGRPAEAAAAFRNALHYRREDSHLQLRLAQALAAADRRAEARSYLRALWRRDPSDGPVNLELARLAARTGDEHVAEEHYRRALEGYWPADGAAQRRGVRIELADYLMARERPDEARAELIALAAALPENPELYVDAGERLMVAGAYRSARDLFERALRLDPGDRRARAGVGRAAFETSEYEAARMHLIRLRRETKQLDPPLAALLALATNVIGTDPDRPRLSTAERARRAAEIVRVTVLRVDACRHELRAQGDHARADALDEAAARLADVVPVATQRGLQRDPDTIPEVVDVAYDVARASAEGCGPLGDRDLAILTLARAQPPPEPDAGS